MANGWAGDGAVQEQIQDSINDEIRRARKKSPAERVWNFVKNAEKKSPLPAERLCPASGFASIARKKPTKNKKPSASTIAAAAKTASCVKRHNQN